MKTITKLLCLLAFVALTTKNYAQTMAHNYKEGICILAGKPVVTRTEGTTCPGCVDADKKNQEAKNKEDNRIREIAVKKAEEERQKAIERQKKENERIAAEQKKAKENVLQLGFANSDKKTEKTSIIYNNKSNIKKDKLTIVEDKDGNETYHLVNQDDEKILTVSNGTLSSLGEWSKSNNIFRIKENLEIGFSEYRMGKLDLIDSKGEKIFKRDDIMSISDCGNGYYLLEIPGSWSSDKITTNGWGKSYRHTHSRFVLYNHISKKQFPLAHDVMEHRAILIILDKIDEYKLHQYTLNKIETNPDKANFTFLLLLETNLMEPNRAGYDGACYYFDEKNLKWKLLYGANSKEWKDLHR